MSDETNLIKLENLNKNKINDVEIKDKDIQNMNKYYTQNEDTKIEFEEYEKAMNRWKNIKSDFDNC